MSLLQSNPNHPDRHFKQKFKTPSVFIGQRKIVFTFHMMEFAGVVDSYQYSGIISSYHASEICQIVSKIILPDCYTGLT